MFMGGMELNGKNFLGRQPSFKQSMVMILMQS